MALLCHQNVTCSKEISQLQKNTKSVERKSTQQLEHARPSRFNGIIERRGAPFDHHHTALPSARKQNSPHHANNVHVM
jgi:hypothetical protein